MPIIFHERTKEFHLYNESISYIFGVLRNGQLGQIYYGRRIKDREDFGYLVEYARRDMAPNAFEGSHHFSLEHLKQEYPTYGSGDMRYPAFELEQENGSRAVDFQYESCNIFQGKKPLDGLPSVYTEADAEATTLEVVLLDKVIQMEIILSYTIYEELPVITKNVRFRNRGEKEVTLLNAMSGCMDLPDKEYEMVELAGAWSRERHIKEQSLYYGIQGVYSLRGCSSHQFNPFLALKRKQADEFTGEVIGFSLVYSGDFIAQAEVDNFDVTRVLLGIHPNEFKWSLLQEEEFQTPELVMVYSDGGLNKMSQTYHKLYRERLARGRWRDQTRPILINNWEATYFDFDEEKILGLAEKAAGLGVELFVLDDGWFGKRNSDESSLGDWYPNLEKLPEGIRGLSRKITAMGMKFGLWFEPEMVNKDSDLFRRHKEWVLADLERNYCHSRNQYVLDFSKDEVVEYIYQEMKAILSDSDISYIKWDMNRSFSEVFSNGREKKDQGKVRHKYILGVYRLYEMLNRDFPEILFESCASGGARFDPGMLYYAPQAWTSDNTDAVDRIKIQYGTSLVYPLSCIGSHVSESPNHQVFRNTSFDMRANVAYFGTFGYEMDITKMTEPESEQMKLQIQFMKEFRGLIQRGIFYRLKSPFEHNTSAWMVVDEDRERALVGYYRILEPVHGAFEKIKLQGLDTEKSYHVAEYIEGRKIEYEQTHYGDELMHYGISVSDHSSGLTGVLKEQQGDFMSRLFYIEDR